MGDLLLFTPSQRSHRDKLEDLLKALLKKKAKYISKEMSIVQNKFAIHG